eukprot:TRINITY_DN2998_c0_g1_i1.p5 TRINITY_DN2998_c0_g1~~TRINITY_DN2998_c0_g1_i1.p5  ORF type:complete len:172 (+),score=8.85 TRINITY_DN2998_c0_g1_i1:127-642(+)
MIRRPPRSTHCISSAASDVYKRQYQRRVHGKGNPDGQNNVQNTTVNPHQSFIPRHIDCASFHLQTSTYSAIQPRSIPNRLRAPCANAPRATPRETARITGVLKQFMIHTLICGKAGEIAEPMDVPPNITKQADKRSAVASKLRARNARQAAEPMQKHNKEKTVEPPDTAVF